MKRIPFILLFIILHLSAIQAQETYYYRLTGVVIDGTKRNPGTSSGLFVTFNKNVCYDSDKDGYSNGMGTLYRVAENNQSIKYSGYCFFGNADYVVSKNKDLINIWNSERKVYIYNRETPSSGTSNSFYGNIVCLYAPKEVAAPTTDPSNNQIINNPSSTKSSHSSHDLECKACYGSGKCSYCGGRGWKIIEDTVQDCIICHGSGRCQSCHGKGKIHSY